MKSSETNTTADRRRQYHTDATTDAANAALQELDDDCFFFVHLMNVKI